MPYVSVILYYTIALFYNSFCWGYWDISVMPSIESYLTLLMTLFMTQLYES
jgi:hypothetical protein